MATAIIEFDPLADSVRSRTKNHDLRSIGRLGLIFLFKGRVEIGGVGFKLRAAGVDALVNWNQAKVFSISSDLVFAPLCQISKTAIRQGGFLECAQQVERNVFQLPAFNLLLDFHYLLELIQEPRINARETINLVNCPSMLQCVSDIREPL